jgi:heavy metal translocating P-type ATPase
VVIGAGGIVMLINIAKSLMRKDPGADILAAISIICAAVMGEYLVSAIIVLMLSGGEALEHACTARASAVLDALAKRSPEIAHRFTGDGDATQDIKVEDIKVGDKLLVMPHEVTPVDGEVIKGRGSMDESYLTGEPYTITKSKGSQVMSGAINGDAALVIKATKLAKDSRYAQIVGVLTKAEAKRPRMRRLADRLGTWYTPVAVILGIVGWVVSGDPKRFLAVVVIATPCPLLIGVPVAIIGAISLAARAGIVIRDPGILERVSTTKTMLFDKTGTLTYGRPELMATTLGPGAQKAVALAHLDAAPSGDVETTAVLAVTARVEAFSRHPLALALVEAAKLRPQVAQTKVAAPDRISEKPGQGLVGELDGHEIRLTDRAQAEKILGPSAASALPAPSGGMESVLLIDSQYAAFFQFRDVPRLGARSFIEHLGPLHGIHNTIMISGDTSGEAQWVADSVGIKKVYAGCSPEQKLAIVRKETAEGPTMFLGDGLNDAPAMTAATVGVAFGRESDVTSEAAGAVILDSSLERVDELLHIGRRMRTIALQSVLGGMALSLIGMGFAVAGMLPPVVGAVAQECIDLVAVLNAARVSLARKPLADFSGYRNPGEPPQDPAELAAQKAAAAESPS